MIRKQKSTRNQDVSLMELKSPSGSLFKVTKRVPNLAIADTRVFRSKKKAKERFDTW